MRECWVNVYVWTDGTQKCGSQFPARKMALAAAAGMPSTTPFHAAYRLHVRLKPELSYEERLARFSARADAMLGGCR